jgi:hypothetical protein
LSLDQLPEWDIVLGLQFENLVLNNLSALTRHLGLERTPLLAAGPYSQRATVRKKGCQIDLLIRTKHALHVVEIKRRKSIDLSVVDEVREKVLRLPSDRNLSVRTALVYEGTLDPRVETEGYFDFIIPFARFLKGD